MADEAFPETFELKLYRISPLGPAATTFLLGVVIYGSFLGIIALTSNLPAYYQDPQGQSTLRGAFILTLILCAAFGVNFYEHRASLKDRTEMSRLMPGINWEHNSPGKPIRIATVIGAILGLAYIVVLFFRETDGNVLTFFSSILLWYAPVLPLMLVLLLRGITQTVTTGRAMSRNINGKLKVDLYRHHELALFGRAALRGAFAWLIFVGVIMLFFTDDNAGGLTIPTLLISTSIAFYAFFNTMRPVRKKILAAKEIELSAIRARLEKARNNLDDPLALQEIPALIALEHRIETIRNWPIDLPTVAFIPLYMLVPVATLVAGAFLESLIGSIFF